MRLLDPLELGPLEQASRMPLTFAGGSVPARRADALSAADGLPRSVVSTQITAIMTYRIGDLYPHAADCTEEG